MAGFVKSTPSHTYISKGSRGTVHQTEKCSKGMYVGLDRALEADKKV